MAEHNKLVRDKIPEICRANGQTPVVRILTDEEYLKKLEDKLDEEVAEFHEARNPMELADILEVVYALAETCDCTIEQLHGFYAKKHAERGGFAEKIFLISTKETCEELP